MNKVKENFACPRCEAKIPLDTFEPFPREFVASCDACGLRMRFKRESPAPLLVPFEGSVRLHFDKNPSLHAVVATMCRVAGDLHFENVTKEGDEMPSLVLE